MTLQQIRYINEISKHSSISKAAQALFVTQPSISKAVKELEDELGIRILDRNSKGILFTKEGSELLSYAKMLLEQTESITYHFNRQKNPDILKLCISSQHYGFAIQALAKLMETCHAKKYEFTIRECKTSDVIDDVYNNKSIIGILSIGDTTELFFQRHFTSKNLVFTPLKSMQIHAFLRKEHPLAGNDMVTLDQLKNYPCLTYLQDDSSFHFAEEALVVENPDKLVYIKDRGATNNLISNTDSYNIGTGCIIPNYMDSNIISIPIDGGEQISLGWIRRYDAALSPDILTYISYLEKCISLSSPLQ